MTNISKDITLHVKTSDQSKVKINPGEAEVEAYRELHF